MATFAVAGCPVHKPPAHRSHSALHKFKVLTGFPNGRPGYVIDHMKPLYCGGKDEPENMQWQTIAEAKAKDRTECECERWSP